MGQWQYKSYQLGPIPLENPRAHGILTYHWEPGPSDPVSVGFDVSAQCDATDPADLAKFHAMCEVSIQTAVAIATSIGNLNSGDFH